MNRVPVTHKCIPIPSIAALLEAYRRRPPERHAGDIPNWLTSKNSSGSGEVQWRVSEKA